jgi:NitT/TauT family transport system permease protein
MHTTQDTIRAVTLPILTAILLLATWQGMTIWTSIPRTILPAPIDISREFAVSLPELLRHGMVSGIEATLSCVIATMAGVIGAVLIVQSRLLRDMLYPAIVMFQLIPKVALAPLFIVWLGTDSTARIAFAVFLSFFPVLVATELGLQSVDGNAVRLCRSLNATEWQIFRSIRVPSALPFFFSGLKVAVTMAVTGIIVAEFISAQSGLGFLILQLASRVETMKMFAAIAMLCLIGLSLYGAVELGERRVRRWYRGS